MTRLFLVVHPASLILRGPPEQRDARRRLRYLDGIADLHALHSRWHDAEVQLYPFEIPALDG